MRELKKNQMASNIQEGGSEREFECKACDKIFNSKKLLKGHIKVTHFREIKCKSCEETFVRNSDLEVHIKTNISQMVNTNVRRVAKHLH